MKILVIIAGTAILTFAIRFMPLMCFASFKLPRLVDLWLRYVIIAILSAMLFKSLFLFQGQFLLSWDFRLLGAIASIIAALLTRSLLITVIIGTTVVCIGTTLGYVL